MPDILVFDVLETLLSLDRLRPMFCRLFGTPDAAQEWYTQALFYSQTLTITGPYAEFGQLGGAVLQMLGAAHGRKVRERDLGELAALTASLDPHPDARDALVALKRAGFRLATLTNSAPATLEKQLRHAGLTELFERDFSVDTVRRFKPASEAYHLVAREMQVSPTRLLLVAAHTWDTIGALNAGCGAALVTRSGSRPLPGTPQPHIVGADLAEVAAAIIRRG